MNDSEKTKKRVAYISELKQKGMYWTRKLNKYIDEFHDVYSKVEWNQDILNEESFNKKIKSLELVIINCGKVLEGGDKSYLKNIGWDPSEWEIKGDVKHISRKGIYNASTDMLILPENIKHWEKKMLALYDRREELRAIQIRMDTLKKKIMKAELEINKVDTLLKEEYKKIHQESNKSLFELLKKKE